MAALYTGWLLKQLQPPTEAQAARRLVPLAIMALDAVRGTLGEIAAQQGGASLRAAVRLIAAT